MYRTYNSFMMILCAFLILLVKPVASFLFKKDFYEAWVFVPPLLISVIFGALTGFLGSICLAYKDSKSMGIATGTGAVVNVAMNFALVPYFSAMGAAVATAVSYALMCAMAYRFVRKYVVIENNILSDALGYLILVAMSVAMIGNIRGKYVICIVLTAVIILICAKEAGMIVQKLFAILKGRLNGK